MSGTPMPLPGPWDTRLPVGFTVELAADAHRSRDGRLLLGGALPRLLRLGPTAARLLDGGRFTVTGRTSAALARRLLDIGAVHPRPPVAPGDGGVRTTVVVPARDRADLVEGLLARLRDDPKTAELPVLVVDDGSRDPAALARAAARHGATLLRHPRNLGPAAARNTGLRHAATPYVAFLDSDVAPRPGWLAPLLAQFADPAVALAAPRIVAAPAPAGRRGVLDRYEAVRSPLDMGPREGPVVPLSALAYVPSATLVVRRAALGAGFDPRLRVAEDVDLCMRLYEAGWRLRYVPGATVGHHHRTGLRDWLGQRAGYGTGAAELALRHPGQVPPLHAAPWSVAACALLLRGRPLPAAAAVTLAGVTAVRLARRMPDADTPVRAAALLTLAGLRGTAEQLLRCATRHHWPLALAAGAASRRARRLLLAAALAEGLLDHRRAASGLGPLTHTAVRRLDDLAYGWGVWHGALRRRTAGPLLPRIVRTATPVRPAAATPRPRTPRPAHQPSANLPAPH
ncbi:mycofactocin system glycosyltransferase [Streptomyces sp. Ru73]|uniref:mycofactocin biosynthesis glycosyltransferase MftF n=1 Tax=Streptomyces sp. Ru73 TaxID=2080748 RepID=UPI000CDE23AC|nr:mycofactocin biosynthesis glycosyltransferase MftF [Streptomyces sp. Ru73]POX38528.1 mycofactocin system glycosyltransferase [Streptomyces sp. Ru73]